MGNEFRVWRLKNNEAKLVSIFNHEAQIKAVSISPNNE